MEVGTVCDLDIARYVIWNGLCTNPLRVHATLFSKTYESIYEHDVVHEQYANNLDTRVNVRIFTYNKIKSMENIISFVEKYVQYPFMVAFGLYLVYHLGLGCM